MSYQLKHRETLGENLRRICRQQIEAAIAIAKGEKKPNDTPVHETRKHLKKTRAALRLVRKEIGRGLFKQRDRCLRDVGRLTSEIRDAEVRLQTVRQLQELTQRHRLRGYDAVQLATALVASEILQSQHLPAPTFVAADNDLLTAALSEHLPVEHPLHHTDLDAQAFP